MVEGGEGGGVGNKGGGKKGESDNEARKAKKLGAMWVLPQAITLVCLLAAQSDLNLLLQAISSR